MTSESSPDVPCVTTPLDAVGLLLQVPALTAVLVTALLLLRAAPLALAMSVLAVLLVAGTAVIVWLTMRFLAFDEEGDPSWLPGLPPCGEPPRISHQRG